MISDTSFLLIGALALQANTTKDTIRHYNELGLLKSRKRQAGSRLYTEFYPECIGRIKMIKSAQAVGFNLSEIKVWLNDYYDGNFDIDKQMDVISKKIAQVRVQQSNITNVINQLSAHYKTLEAIKSDHTTIFPKIKWEERVMELTT